MTSVQSPRQPIVNAPPVTFALCLALCGLWGFFQLAPEEWTYVVLARLSLFPPDFLAVASGAAGLDTVPIVATLLTHALVHVDGLHLLVNVGFLLAIGSQCERALGVPRYVLLLLGATVAGGAVQLAADWGEQVVVYGASGAVSGCLGALARLAFGGRLPAARRFALAIVGVVVLTNILLALVGGDLVGADAQVAWQAHLGGLAAGLLFGWPPRRRSPPNLDKS
ncbi:MAG: rhomboid family intramembrane serine protease [Rhodospirillaceae bacterium]|nr:rhomboid family intramembrane serine protease [Rhodospirillaceae bacterium]MCA8932141.1 rhomboid family intramembrane serine protease [Rhodospirillaceae bacterium]